MKHHESPKRQVYAMDIDRELQDFLHARSEGAQFEHKRAIIKFFQDHPEFSITPEDVYLFLYIGLLIHSLKSYKSPLSKQAEWELEKRQEPKTPAQPKPSTTPKAPSTTPKPRPHGEPPSPAPEGMRWHWREHKGGEGK
jgi:hypothetical protein